MIKTENGGVPGTNPVSGNMVATRYDNDEESGTIVETEYLCGCKSREPHAPEYCPFHGESISVTRISVTAVPKP